MNRSVRTFLLAALVAVPALFASARSDAGQGVSPVALYCVVNADTSGYCAGSFLGVQSDSTPDDTMELVMGGSGSGTSTLASYGYFQAYANHRYYFCNASPQVLSLWPVMQSARGEIMVSWDAHGTCGGVTTYNGTIYSHY